MRRLLLLATLLSSTLALAQTTAVNQGRPGSYGPWYMRESGTAGTPTTTSGRNAARPAVTSTTISSNATPCTAAGGASCTIIYAATDWLQWPNFTVTIHNSGANAIDNVLIEFSADGTNFEVWDSAIFASLAASAVKSLSFSGQSRRYLRIEARSASGSSAQVHITANDG